MLGIARNKITKLPSSITRLAKLREINVNETPLKQPKLALAMRGIRAIRDFFQQNEVEQEVESKADKAAKEEKDQEQEKAQEELIEAQAEGDKLQVLSDEMAQAILFKKKDLM